MPDQITAALYMYKCVRCSWGGNVTVPSQLPPTSVHKFCQCPVHDLASTYVERRDQHLQMPVIHQAASIPNDGK